MEQNNKNLLGIKTLEISGFVAVMNALRLPFGKEARSETFFEVENDTDHLSYGSRSDVYFDPKDIKLLSTLVQRGDEHAKAVRGLVVYAEIDAPVYWWCELETYTHAGHERLSSESTMHVDCKGLTGNDLVDAKAAIPMGKRLRKTDYYSYQCLRNIVRQRHDHRLPHWHEFVKWVATLPYAKELIFVGLDIDLKEYV